MEEIDNILNPLINILNEQKGKFLNQVQLPVPMFSELLEILKQYVNAHEKAKVILSLLEPEKFKQEQERANNLFNDGKYEEALLIFKHLNGIKYNSCNFQRTSECYLKLNKFGDAGDTYIYHIDRIISDKIYVDRFIIDSLLSLAERCYKLSGNNEKADKIEEVLAGIKVLYAYELVQFQQTLDNDMKYLQNVNN